MMDWHEARQTIRRMASDYQYQQTSQGEPTEDTPRAPVPWPVSEVIAAADAYALSLAREVLEYDEHEPQAWDSGNAEGEIVTTYCCKYHRLAAEIAEVRGGE